jgi:GntR family transcriptional regulator / MocR family aminotransferase
LGRYSDRQGDQTLECALAELFQGGDVQRHIRRAKRVYQARRDFLANELQRRLAGVASFRVPAGGMAIWTKVATDVNVQAWASRAGQKGVVFLTARSFAFDEKSRPYIRLGFGGLTEPQIREAVKRMSESLS